MVKRKTAETASKASKLSTLPDKRKRSLQTKECVICIDAKPLYRNFPAFSTCSHEPDTCSSCIAKHTITLLERSRGIGWTVCRCPQCDVTIPPEEVQGALPRAMVREMNEMINKKFESTQDSWRWCLAAGCGHGSLHDRRHEMIRCRRCQYKMCFKHQVPWHGGYTCREYERSHPQSAITKTNEEMIGTMSKPCPGCGIAIEKVGGCSHMICSQCGLSWTWNTVPPEGQGLISALTTVVDSASRLGNFTVAGRNAFQPAFNLNPNLSPLPMCAEGYREDVNQQAREANLRLHMQSRTGMQSSQLPHNSMLQIQPPALVPPFTIIEESYSANGRGPPRSSTAGRMTFGWVAQGRSAETAIDLT